LADEKDVWPAPFAASARIIRHCGPTGPRERAARWQAPRSNPGPRV